MTIKTYTELITIPSFEGRYEYLRIKGRVGEETFGFDRFINQNFYRSSEWKSIRDQVIFRDNGCDLAMSGYEIYGKIYIHHINPITINDICQKSDFLMNPEYLISTTHSTHNAIHYGDKSKIISCDIKRNKYDTCPWRQN